MEGVNQEESAQATSASAGDAQSPLPVHRRRTWLLGIIALGLFSLLGGVAFLFWGEAPVLRPRGVGTVPTMVVSPSPSPVLAVPAPFPIGVASPAPSPSPRGATATTYTVEPGDTLRSIAETVYGDPEAWGPIYEANQEVIGPTPDDLPAGIQLRIPQR